MPVKTFLLLCFLCLLRLTARAQTIRGEVLDMEDKHAVTGVNIQNIYTLLDISTDDKGAFLIAATGGQLLEFKKPGYKTVRVRVPMGYIPSYFRIIMQKGISEMQETYVTTHSNRYDYSSDSARFHELYKHELDFPKMSGIDMVASPFSAFSRKNREIWQFQEDFDYFEKEKYVDRTFNEPLISKFTGLTGDSLHNYMRRYRPSYDQLRSMNDYALYSFIKTSVYNYRNITTPRGSK